MKVERIRWKRVKNFNIIADETKKEMKKTFCLFSNLDCGMLIFQFWFYNLDLKFEFGQVFIRFLFPSLSFPRSLPFFIKLNGYRERDRNRRNERDASSTERTREIISEEIVEKNSKSRWTFKWFMHRHPCARMHIYTLLIMCTVLTTESNCWWKLYWFDWVTQTAARENIFHGFILNENSATYHKQKKVCHIALMKAKKINKQRKVKSFIKKWNTYFECACTHEPLL